MSNVQATNEYDVQMAKIQMENNKIDLAKSIFAETGDVKAILALIGPSGEIETGVVQHSNFSKVAPMSPQSSSPVQQDAEEQKEETRKEEVIQKPKRKIEWIEDPSGKSRAQCVLDACRELRDGKKRITVKTIVSMMRQYGRYESTEDVGRNASQMNSMSGILNELTNDKYLTKKFDGDLTFWRPTKQTISNNYRHKNAKRKQRTGPNFEASKLSEPILEYMVQRPDRLGPFRYMQEIQRMKSFPLIKDVLETDCPYPDDDALAKAIGSQICALVNKKRVKRIGRAYEVDPDVKREYQRNVNQDTLFQK